MPAKRGPRCSVQQPHIVAVHGGTAWVRQQVFAAVQRGLLRRLKQGAGVPYTTKAGESPAPARAGTGLSACAGARRARR